MLKKLFSIDAVAVAINALPEIETPILDEFYPKNIRQMHPFASIGVDELIQIAKAVPVVQRGGTAVAIGSGKGAISLIEPLPVYIQEFVDAKTINDLKILTAVGQQAYVNSRIDFMRRTVYATMEALAGQSLSGAISYAMKTDAGLDTYEVDFGTIPTFTPTKKWDLETTTLKDIRKDLRTMAKMVQKAGFGSKVKFRSGETVFDAIVDKIEALPNDQRSDAKVDENVISLGGFKINLFVSSYYDPKLKDYVQPIAATAIQAFSENISFNFKYLAIDDLDAGLQPTPLFIKTVKMEAPSGYNLIGNSKPLPIPVVKSMVKATVAG